MPRKRQPDGMVQDTFFESPEVDPLETCKRIIPTIKRGKSYLTADSQILRARAIDNIPADKEARISVLAGAVIVEPDSRNDDHGPVPNYIISLSTPLTTVHPGAEPGTVKFDDDVSDELYEVNSANLRRQKSNPLGIVINFNEGTDINNGTLQILDKLAPGWKGERVGPVIMIINATQMGLYYCNGDAQKIMNLSVTDRQGEEMFACQEYELVQGREIAYNFPLSGASIEP